MVILSGAATAGADAGTASAAAEAADDWRNERRVVMAVGGVRGLANPDREGGGGVNPTPSLTVGIRPDSLSQLVEDVLGDPNDRGVVAAEAVAPVGGADRDDRAAAGVSAEDGVARAALLPFLVPL